ncbi:MAG: hypothetical protein HUU37_06095 [Bdellovibrionales bacterium]|nr:hypothetical protein [Bdellovibrionales bacterium]
MSNLWIAAVFFLAGIASAETEVPDLLTKEKLDGYKSRLTDVVKAELDETRMSLEHDRLVQEFRISGASMFSDMHRRYHPEKYRARDVADDSAEDSGDARKAE